MTDATAPADLAIKPAPCLVRLVNHSAAPFAGWLRCNVDVMPPHRVGYVSNDDGATVFDMFMLGRPSGLDTRTLDIHVHLDAGERRTIDLAKSRAISWPITPLPSDLAFFGGLVTIAGIPMTLLALEPNAAGYDAHLRAHVGPMLVVDLWLTYWPDQPGWCTGRVAITPSNPNVQDVTALIPPDFTLRFGDAIVQVIGRQPNAPLLDAGDWQADAQPKLLPVIFCWLRHTSDWASVKALADLQVQINGLQRLHADGNPILSADFDALAWTNSLLPESIRRLHSHEQPVYGPNLNSDDAGAQGGQSFVGGPAQADPSTVSVLYLNALQVRWPFCHLEANGDQLDYTKHQNPRLYLWDGRVNRNLSRDTLRARSQSRNRLMLGRCATVVFFASESLCGERI